MLEKVKESLRIKTDKLNNEINDLIEAAKMDLLISGVVNIVESDPLIIRAIILYCKANFGLDNDEADKYQSRYESLKIHLSLCTDYNTESEVDNNVE